MFTRRTVPVPPQVGQAPPLLKASSSAPGPKKVFPQVAHVIGCSAATDMEGGA